MGLSIALGPREDFQKESPVDVVPIAHVEEHIEERLQIVHMIVRAEFLRLK